LADELTNREKTILRYIVEDFIQTANPVGSRYISRKKDLKLSPATIRNVMSDLEELKFLTHTHTSGGRVPTDKGYRYFVNELMDAVPLKSGELTCLNRKLASLIFSPMKFIKKYQRFSVRYKRNQYSQPALFIRRYF